MSLQDEIREQKKENDNITIKKQSQHRQAVEDTRKMIPEMAEYLKNKAVAMAAREDEDYFSRKVHKYSIFSKKRYMECELWLYESGEKERKWYFALIRCPEVYNELKNAIEKKGLKNVRIQGKNQSHPYFMITASIDLN